MMKLVLVSFRFGQVMEESLTMTTFRIKIWEEADRSETVVYDNGSDQLIARGQIKVHAPKEKVQALRGRYGCSQKA